AEDGIRDGHVTGVQTCALPISTFLKQSGVPELSTTMHCEKGKQPTLEVKQRRLLPAGSEGSTDRTWTIPFALHIRLKPADMMPRSEERRVGKEGGLWLVG